MSTHADTAARTVARCDSTVAQSKVGLLVTVTLVIGSGAGVFALPFALAPDGPTSLAAFVLVTMGALALALTVWATSNRVPRSVGPAPDHCEGIGAGAYGLDGAEVTNAVFESGQSLVFDLAEKRLHIIKALLVAALAP
jgi:hypothetical protein